MKPIKYLLTIFAIIVLIMAAGCDNQNTKTTNDGNTATTQSEQQSQKVATTSILEDKPDTQKQTQTEITVYFPDANAEKLIAVKRQIPANDNKYVNAINELITGPANDSEGFTIMPKGTKVLSVNVNNNIATVDFSKEFQNNFTGGSTGEIMLVGSIVDTLTDFKEIKSVRFTLEGQPLDILGGHLDLTEPVSRMNDLL
ncbi:GerMN domain-containing protein [Megamonas hypermegale]|uniref:GerMN domain-containing protein n=1 Tax=Megamonas hypermegale TaxID=158847 RepID=UPI00195D9AA6|nr:GerMN domain-containing protein [Megamonas hypermegale]MBM6761362.1 GerMN domain-containing protein [Megamonas hypermegale]MBM6832799.1 GerMN domain-containing protein [Megamonas hypermegale]